MSIFGDIANGLKWLVGEATHPGTWVPKVVTITEDVVEDVGTLLPEAVQIFSDTEVLALAAVADGGQMISQINVLLLGISQAIAVGGIEDIAADQAVIAALKGLISYLENKNNWAQVLQALGQLIKDYDTFGASAKAAIAKI
jgi:hypothetical protein